jgi:hypothetical protein
MTTIAHNLTLPVVQVADASVHKVIYKGDPVVTFAMVDEIHQRPEGTASRNFRDNRERFVEGVDFIELTADEIRRQSLRDVFPPRTAKAIILTERGYLKLVKPMQDDRAWVVQGEMITCYFKTRAEEIVPAQSWPSVSLAREARLQLRQFTLVGKQLGLDNNQAILSANHATMALTGVDMLDLLGVVHLNAPESYQVFNPSEIGHRLGGHNAISVNKLLVNLGYQIQLRDHRGCGYYELTDKGRASGGLMKDTKKRHDNGTPVMQLMWSIQIIELLCSNLIAEPV